SHRWNWRGQLPLDRARVLAFAWLIVPVVFFSFSESKLPAYILPALPAVAVLVGDRIACFCRESRGDKVLRLTGAFLIVVAGAAAWYLHRDSSVPLASLLFATSHLILLGGLAIALARFRVQIFLLISIVTLGTAVMGVRIVAPSVAKRESVRDLLAVAAARGYANTPVVQLETLERTVEFYAAGRISYGGDADPEILETMPQLLNAARQNDGVVLCFARVELAPLLVKSKLADSEIISDNGRTALLVVHSK
ncbi:MAG TPA: hypothetical protein VE863_05840, partial [Pyrinomonadaceae bacterium]|nr:hypothetical protein [Pyrinomonadaceae bacterium]